MHCGGKKTTSEIVLVCNLSDLGPPSVSASDTSAKANVTPLPVVEKEEINFQRKMSLAEVPLVSCTGACGSEPKLQ